MKIAVNPESVQEEINHIESLKNQVENDNMQNKIMETFVDKIVEANPKFESVVTILAYILIFLKKKFIRFNSLIQEEGFSATRLKSRQMLYRLAKPSLEQIKSLEKQFNIRMDDNGTFLLT